MSDKRVQLYCAYSVFGFIAAFLIGWCCWPGLCHRPHPPHPQNISPSCTGIGCSASGPAW